MREEIDTELLMQEYFHLQDLVESADHKTLTIKSWSVTLSMMGIGVSILYKAPFISLLAGLSSLLFWIIEAFWKIFQNCHYPRMIEIENFMAGHHLENFSYPKIHYSWLNSFNKLPNSLAGGQTY